MGHRMSWAPSPKDAEKMLSSLLQNLRVPHVVASSKAVPGRLGDWGFPKICHGSVKIVGVTQANSWVGGPRWLPLLTDNDNNCSFCYAKNLHYSLFGYWRIMTTTFALPNCLPSCGQIGASCHRYLDLTQLVTFTMVARVIKNYLRQIQFIIFVTVYHSISLLTPLLHIQL